MQGSETFLNVFIFFLIFAGIILDKMGVRFTAVLSGAVMLVGATINWYALTDMFLGSSLETWFNNHLNYIPVFDELGISPFYQGMPASAKFSAVGFMIFGCGVEMAGINGNYAIDAGLKIADALAFEASDGAAAQEYVNVIAVKAGNENSEKIQALVNALMSEEVKIFIEDNYAGAVVPMF